MYASNRVGHTPIPNQTSAEKTTTFEKCKNTEFKKT